MHALAASHDASVQMIDTSIVRVHQRGACNLAFAQLASIRLRLRVNESAS
jgi:hypothetical protein